jgi:hypothetical protein
MLVSYSLKTGMGFQNNQIQKIIWLAVRFARNKIGKVQGRIHKKSPRRIGGFNIWMG